MRTLGILAILAFGPCDKADATASGEAGSAAPSATATAATGTGTTGTTTTAAGTAAATGIATVGSPNKGVVVNADSGTTIVNNEKRIDFDGGQLSLKNDAGLGTITQTDAGVVLKGKDGKTLTLPPVPGLK